MDQDWDKLGAVVNKVTNLQVARFEVLTAAMLNIPVFCDVTPCLEWAVPNASKAASAFTYRIPWSKNELLDSKRSTKTSGITRLKTQRHMTEQLNLRPSGSIKCGQFD